MSKIICIGGGVMASAFAVAQAGRHQVAIIPTPFDNNTVSSIKASNHDDRLGVDWPAIDFLSVNDVDDFDLIVVGVSSAGITWALNIIESLLAKHSAPVVLLTKGLVKDGEKLIPLSVYINNRIECDVLAITGPCIAKELAEGRYTHIELSGKSQDVLVDVRDILQRPNYEISIHTDYIGAQWSAALKNVYAIVIACSGDRLNMRSSMFSKSLQEMSTWVSEQGGNPEAVMGLSGAGDLYVTCLGGRNGRLGSLIAEGLSIEAITSGPMKGVTVEGLDLAYDLIKLPIAKDKPLFQRLASLL